MDFDAYLVVAAFLGRVPTTGRQISVQRLSLEKGVLRVAASAPRPLPEGYSKPAFTTPYHVVRIPRSALPKA